MPASRLPRELDESIGGEQALRPLEFPCVAYPKLILKDIGPRNEVWIAPGTPRPITIIRAQGAWNEEGGTLVPARLGIGMT